MVSLKKTEGALVGLLTVDFTRHASVQALTQTAMMKMIGSAQH